MPRSADGSYSLPAGTLVNTGDTIEVTQHNPAFQDVASALTGSLDRDGNGSMRADLDMGSHKISNVSPGVASTDVATVGQLSSGTGMPIGSIIDFAGSVSPDGWLICAGQSLTRADYADLFAVIGTAYGAPSGSTFSLPDCRGRVTAGRDIDSGGTAGRLTATTMSPNGTTLGATGGAQTQTLTSDQMPSHTHAVTGSTDSAGSHSHNVPLSNSTGSSNVARTGTTSDTAVATDAAGAHTHNVTGTAASTGGGQAHANVQPTILFNKIIKASNS